MEVRRIKGNEAHPLILNVHYAKRIPSISFAFGLFDGEILEGVCTFGQPASPWLCKGIAGEENRKNVIELNRLVLLRNRKNDASWFVSRCLKGLPSPLYIVSYSDLAQKHEGVVYRALNFYYTGTTKPRTDIAAGDGKHSRHHKGDRSKRVFRSSKHRYVYLHGNRREKRKMLEQLNYKPVTYPPKPSKGGEA